MLEAQNTPQANLKQSLTPKQIVELLDKRIIGQSDAKKSVAIALRNRFRRAVLPEDVKADIIPKNILMVGSTGVGKTEIARTLAKILNAPFIKVEATKYTEIGYVGKDVESIIKDLVEVAVKNTKLKKRKTYLQKAKEAAYNKIMIELVGPNPSKETFEKFKTQLDSGTLDDKMIDIMVEAQSNPLGGGAIDIPGGSGQIGIGAISMGEIFGKAFSNKKKKTVKIADAKKILTEECLNELMEDEDIATEALKDAEENGIVFIDEIDKIAFSNNAKGGEVSREGVQRDLLPIVEGTIVNTKYGIIKTDYMLFIASGAFHSSKPSDLSPELQGRFPVRVNLKSLSIEDYKRILIEPENSILKQYSALLLTEGVEVSLSDESVEYIAKLTDRLNKEIEDLGARRLISVVETLFTELNFEASELPESSKKIVIDIAYIEKHLEKLIKLHKDLKNSLI